MKKKYLLWITLIFLAVLVISFVVAKTFVKKMDSVQSYTDLAASSKGLLARVYLAFKPIDIPGFEEVITSDTRWKKRQSPIIVEKNTMVIPGATLTIDPGVEVIMNKGVRLRVQGIITAKGEKDNPIIIRNPGKDETWDLIECVNAIDGAVEGKMGTMTFEHCVIEGGRGVTINGCNAIIRNNVLKNNVSSPIRFEYTGGEIVGNKIFGNSTELESESGNGSGIMVYSDKDVVITDNEIFENVSMGGRDGGGGIYAFAYDGSKITIERNSVRNNKSDRNGGGIVGYKCLIKNNIVEGNRAEQWGGGIYSVQCVVEENRVLKNWAGKGGGLYSDDSTITHNYIFKNSSPPNSGSGLFYYGNGHVTLNTFIENSDEKSGSGETLMLSGNPIISKNNIITSMGHALKIQSHTLSTDMIAVDNYWGTTKPEEIEALVFDWLDDSKFGIVNWKPCKTEPVADAYEFSKNELRDMKVVVKKGEKNHLWGVIEKDMTIGDGNEASYDVTDNILVQEGVTLTLLPGAKLNFLKDKSLRIRGKLIAKGEKGKEIHFIGKENGLWESLIFENRSTGEKSNQINGEEENIADRSVMAYTLVENSNGIIMDGKGAMLSDSIIRNNHNSGIIIKETGASITQCQIYGNNSPKNGGGVYIYGSKLVNIIKNEIRDNTSNEDGGGVFAYGSRSDTAVNLLDNIIQNNRCDGDGGGVWASRSSVTRNIIISNQATSNGGGLYVSFALINDNRIENNQSKQGGGAYAETNSSFERNAFLGNKIKGEFGGAVYLNFWGMSVKNEVFSKNVVEKNISEDPKGNGGICLNGAMEFQKNIIVDNSGTQLYNLNPSTESPFEAKECYWGTMDEKTISGYIVDGGTNTSLSVVKFMPILKSRKESGIN